MEEKRNTKITEREMQDAVPAPKEKLETSAPSDSNLKETELTSQIDQEYSKSREQYTSLPKQERTNNDTSTAKDKHISGQYDQYSMEGQKTFGMFAHILINLCPFALLTSAIGYFFFGKKGDFLKGHMKSLLNLQLTLICASLVIWLVSYISTGLALFMVLVISIGVLVTAVMGAIKAKKGEPWVYPYTYDFIGKFIEKSKA
ncbi:MAG: DUF4870 domain-containing protein [Micrococcaceae bacterium]